jgi:hypothetical protein
MLNLDPYREPNLRNDQIIQRALRDIDSEPMSTAMVGMPEAWQTIIFRNMSVRAVAFIKEDIKRLEKSLAEKPQEIEAAREFFARLLTTHAAEYDAGQVPRPMAAPPPWDGAGEEAIIQSFVALADFCRNNGPLALESLAAHAPDPLLKQGLTMLTEGWDPLVMHNLMQRHKESYLRALAVRMDLIIDGIDNLAAADNPLVMEQKLRSLVARP